MTLDSMHPASALPTLAWTLNDLLRLHPETMSVLNGFGLDLCCGGGLTLEQASTEARADATTVLAAVHEHITLAADDPALAVALAWGVS